MNLQIECNEFFNLNLIDVIQFITDLNNEVLIS